MGQVSGWVHKYEDSHCPPNRGHLVLDGEQRRLGPADFASERFTIQAGDFDPNTQGQRERVEKVQVGPLQREGDEYFYGWSFRVPADYQDSIAVPNTAGYVTFTQFHQKPRPPKKDWDPAWMFGKYPGGSFELRQFPTIHFRAGRPVPSWKLIDDGDFRGRWHDLVVHARWTSSPSGFFRVWVNGELVVDLATATCAPDGADVYHKYGLYRSADPRNPAATAWFSHVRRGTSRHEVTAS